MVSIKQKLLTFKRTNPKKTKRVFFWSEFHYLFYMLNKSIDYLTFKII